MAARATFANRKRGGWHFLYDPGALTVARKLPVRFDVAAQARFPLLSKTRLAQQIRQDLWRALQRVRGFCPVVRVEEDDTHLLVRAGGEIFARTFPKQNIDATIAELLANPENRARWITHARRRPHR